MECYAVDELKKLYTVESDCDFSTSGNINTELTSNKEMQKEKVPITQENVDKLPTQSDKVDENTRPRDESDKQMMYEDDFEGYIFFVSLSSVTSTALITIICAINRNRVSKIK